jgi:hypothetical protein
MCQEGRKAITEEGRKTDYNGRKEGTKKEGKI